RWVASSCERRLSGIVVGIVQGHLDLATFEFFFIHTSLSIMETAAEDVNGDGNPLNDDTDGDGIPDFADADDNGPAPGDSDGDM
ncbi:hypothetical protein C2W62_53860, partial [Candidatus Entotheonella serta]